MKITCLGSGASVPSTERSLPSYAIQIDGDVILLDCGEGTQRQMMKLGVSYSKVQAVFISHLHLDHLLGIFGLSETLRLNGRQEPLYVFAPKGSTPIFHAFRKYGIIKVVEFGEDALSSKKPLFTINEHDIYAHPVSHGKGIDSYGFLIKQKDRLRFYEEKAHKAGVLGPLFKQIEKEGKLKIGKKTVKLSDITYTQAGASLFYTGDTQYSKDVIKAAKGVDLLIHECTFDDSLRQSALEKYHSTASDAAKAAKEAGAKKLLLTHISPRYSDNNLLLSQARKTFENSDVAYDGWTEELK